jgi:uncharacterized protein (TIGR03000 family)
MSKYRFFLPAILGLGLLAMNPLTAEAQRGGQGGGGHGGGGHGGSGHGGGGQGGGGFHSGGGFHGSGGFHGGGFAHGGSFARGHGGFEHHRGFFPGVGFGYGFYNPFWYGGYGSDYGTPYAYYGSPAYDDSYYSGYSGPSYVTPSYDYVSPVAPAAPANNTAELDILLPTADAQVWVDGNKMSITGSYRSFVSPPLEPGYSYTYHVTASWLENGKEVRVERTVPVGAGRISRVDFSSVRTMQQMPPAPE